MRASYATKILNNGVEIRDVADMLGHSNIGTTENYYISRKNATDDFDKIIQSDINNEISEYQILEY